MDKMLSIRPLLVLAFMSSPILSLKLNAKTRAMYDTNAINDAIHILEGSMQNENDLVINIDSGIIKPPPYFDAFQYTDMPCNETDGTVLRIFPEKCMQFVCKYRQVEPVYLYDKQMCNCCEHDGKLYKEGEELPGVCVKMFCCNGKWESTGHINECCGHCDVYGDPHIKPFDAPVTPVNWYHMHSHCNYSLAQKLEFGTQIGSMDPEFAVYAQFGDCASSKVSSCINTITVKDSEHAIVEIEMPDIQSAFDASYIVRMNGWMNYLGMVPTPLYDMWGNRHPVQMWITESGCARLLGSQGFVLHICRYYVRIYAHASLMNDIGGLCGFYNEYDQDDHMTRNGDITPTSYFPQYPSPDFVFSWLTQDNNLDRCKQQPIQPIPQYPQYPAYRNSNATNTTAKSEERQRLIPVMMEDLKSYYSCMDQSQAPYAFSMCDGMLIAWTMEPSQEDYINLLEACIVDYCNTLYADPMFSELFPGLYNQWLNEMTMMNNMTIGPKEEIEPPCTSATPIYVIPTSGEFTMTYIPTASTQVVWMTTYVTETITSTYTQIGSTKTPYQTSTYYPTIGLTAPSAPYMRKQQ